MSQHNTELFTCFFFFFFPTQDSLEVSWWVRFSLISPNAERPNKRKQKSRSAKSKSTAQIIPQPKEWSNFYRKFSCVFLTKSDCDLGHLKLHPCCWSVSQLCLTLCNPMDCRMPNPFIIPERQAVPWQVCSRGSGTFLPQFRVVLSRQTCIT